MKMLTKPITEVNQELNVSVNVFEVFFPVAVFLFKKMYYVNMPVKGYGYFKSQHKDIFHLVSDGFCFFRAVWIGYKFLMVLKQIFEINSYHIHIAIIFKIYLKCRCKK